MGSFFDVNGFGMDWALGVEFGALGGKVGQALAGQPGAVEGARLAQQLVTSHWGDASDPWRPRGEEEEEGAPERRVPSVSGEVVGFVEVLPDDAALQEEFGPLFGATVELLRNDQIDGRPIERPFMVGVDRGAVDYLALNDGPADGAGQKEFTLSDFPTKLQEYSEAGREDIELNPDPFGSPWLTRNVENAMDRLEIPRAEIEKLSQPPRPPPPPRPPFRSKLAKMYGGVEVPEPVDMPFDPELFGVSPQTAEQAPTAGAAVSATASASAAGATQAAGSVGAGATVPGAMKPPAPSVIMPPVNVSTPPVNVSVPSPNVSDALANASSLQGSAGSAVPAGAVGPAAPPGVKADIDGWTYARQVFSGAVEGLGEVGAGMAVGIAKNYAYGIPGVGPLVFAYDVYEAAQAHGGDAGAYVVALNEMFNPLYGAVVAGVGAYDAAMAGDGRELGDELVHVAAGVVLTAMMLEGGGEGLGEGAKGGEPGSAESAVAKPDGYAAAREAAGEPGAAQGEVVPGGSAGAMRAYAYEASPKHGAAARSTAKGVSNPAPKNPEEALRYSTQVKDTSPRRVGIDYDAGEFVVFDETYPGSGIFHGHVRSWGELTPEMQNALRSAGMTNRRGRIVVGDEK